MEETTKRFQNRVSSTPNRRRIKIISQTPTEIVANIEMDDNPTVAGTPISADVLNEWDSDVLLARQKSITAETNSANALAVANLADEKSGNATTLATTAGEIANEAKTIAQNAIEQVVTKQGTKVSENGVVVENFNADTKVNIAQSSANKVLVTDNLGNIVTSSIIPFGDIKIYQEEDNMLNIDCEKGLKINGVNVLDMIYPVGSLYISKENVSPAADFGGDWLCIAENVTLPLGDNAPVIGNGITLGLTNGEQLLGLQMNNSLVPYNNAYGGPIGDGNYGTPAYNQRQLGVTTDAAKSGVIANLSQSTSAVKVYVFRRIA